MQRYIPWSCLRTEFLKVKISIKIWLIDRGLTQPLLDIPIFPCISVCSNSLRKWINYDDAIVPDGTFNGRFKTFKTYFLSAFNHSVMFFNL